ncbi:MAG: hypothetical protein ACTHLT_20355 [Devosia sp.]
MATSRHIAAELLRDIARALAVLALVFLSYAHQPVSVAAQHATLSAAVTADFCGGVPADSQSHAPCHACRIGGGADLPPPCEGLLHLPAVAGPAFPPLAVAAFVVAPPDIPDARGPPALA